MKGVNPLCLHLKKLRGVDQFAHKLTVSQLDPPGKLTCGPDRIANLKMCLKTQKEGLSGHKEEMQYKNRQ